MPDDRSKFPRPKTHWDDDKRAAHGKVRRKTPPHGYPVAIDSELTPPPQPVAIDSGNTVEQNLELVADGLGQVTAAVGRLWDSRNDSERIDKINEQLRTLSADVTKLLTQFGTFIEPFAKQTMGRIGILEERAANVAATTGSFFGREWPNFVETVGQLNQSLGSLVTTSKLLDQELDAIKKRHTEWRETLNAQIDELRIDAENTRLRVVALEQRNRDTDIGDARETALVTRRNRILKATWTALTAAGGAVAGWLAGR
jgi:hypothetical protein